MTKQLFKLPTLQQGEGDFMIIHKKPFPRPRVHATNYLYQVCYDHLEETDFQIFLCKHRYRTKKKRMVYIRRQISQHICFLVSNKDLKRHFTVTHDWAQQDYPSL